MGPIDVRPHQIDVLILEHEAIMVTAKERDFQKPEQFWNRCPQEGVDAMTVTAQILMDVFVT